MDFLFHHSNVVDISRHCGRIEGRPFAVPLISAFHGYHEQTEQQQQQQQLNCNTSSSEKTPNHTDDSDEDDDDNISRGTDHNCSTEVDHTDDGSKRRGEDTLRDVAASDDSGSVRQLTSRKHDYSVAQLLRSDRPSSSAVNDDQTKAEPLDNRQNSEESTPPSKTADSAFHSWNDEKVDRPTAPLPPPFSLSTSQYHRWTQLMVPDNWRRPDSDSGAQRRYFGLFDTPPINFMPAYKHSRRGTELQLPLSKFGQQYSIPRESRQLIDLRMYSNYTFIAFCGYRPKSLFNNLVEVDCGSDTAATILYFKSTRSKLTQ